MVRSTSLALDVREFGGARVTKLDKTYPKKLSVFCWTSLEETLNLLDIRSKFRDTFSKAQPSSRTFALVVTISRADFNAAPPNTGLVESWQGEWDGCRGR